MIVAFYGVEGGTAATTGNLISIALMSHFQYQFKVLMASLSSGLNGLETGFESGRKSFYVAEEAEYFYHQGMDYVIKEAGYHHIHPTVIQRGATEVFPQKVYYLSSANGTGLQRVQKTFRNHGNEILDAMEDFAELVFLDCGPGTGSMFYEILKRADLVVVNLVQNQRVLNQFFLSNTDFREKTVYLLGRYDQQFPCNLNRIITKFRMPEEDIRVIPYNAGFQDAFLSGKCAQFLYKNAYGGFYEKNRLFSKELKAATDMILRKVGVIV